MSDAILMQYLGFKPRNEWREYSFQIRYAVEDVRDFTLVCSAKLRRELSANPNHPSHTNFAISDNELADFKVGHSPKASNHLCGAKPRDEY